MSLRAFFAKQSPELRGDCFVTKNKSVPRKDIILKDIFLFLISTLLIVSCNPSTVQSPLQVVSVHSTFAAEPWLTDLYACADSLATLIRVDDPTSADIALRIDEPEFLSGFAYQIGEEEILVVTNRQSPIQNLDKDGVQALFMGLGDPSLQVRVYASDADVQKVFDQFAMEGRSVASSASLAANPQQMLDSLNGESNSAGILTRHWKAGDLRDVYLVATVPVLALTKSEPVGVVNQLIGCLQSK
ncbi:MAG: hypothetical protein DCC56_07500 [Anaerolineae bacterium]|nr:MAG: hypothetical protein DCC56_07500 [Anaerolineae bacterium]WKZ45568.1 MAG: hypothetical protein QY302_07230 [Anaerolineales bacterium]